MITSKEGAQLGRQRWPGSVVSKASVLLMGCLPAIPVCAHASPSQMPVGTGYLMLKNPLDRPGDGYCLDVAGSGRAVRLDLPMNVHNCKGPGQYDDETVTLAGDGRIRFPAYGDACVTVAGVNGRALPGASVLIRPCGERTPFFDTSMLQVFSMNEDGQIELQGSDLCLAAGEYSASTHHPEHRWRTLSVQDCSEVSLDLSQWELLREENIPGMGKLELELFGEPRVTRADDVREWRDPSATVRLHM